MDACIDAICTFHLCEEDIQNGMLGWGRMVRLKTKRNGWSIYAL